MLALYRCGRQAEALEAYRQARQTLVEEIGVEPAPELRRLHEAILRQDPSLDVEPVAAELPRELDAAASPPLIGRDGELRAAAGAAGSALRRGAGALVTLAGAYGMGKTRLAAEIAAEAHREGAAVLYAAGTGPPEAALAAIAQAREPRRPALLVLDDADRAPAEVRARAARAGAGARSPAGARARHRPGGGRARAPRAARRDRARAARRRRPSGRSPASTRRRRRGRGARRDAAGDEPRRRAPRPRGGARVGAARGDAPRRRAPPTARRPAAARPARSRPSWPAASSSCSRRASAPAWSRATATAPRPVVCPYKGLATFDVEDAEYFFGRERLVAELVARLVGAPLLAVVGPSGSGKSSVLRAGLLPALAGGVLPGSDSWAQALIRPGEQPLRELRRATRRLGREWRSVLAVDQFEELFTACHDEQERAAFVAALVRAARDPTAAASSCSPCAPTSTAAAPPTPSCRACSAPTTCSSARCRATSCGARSSGRRERVGLSVEPELVDALLADVEGQPGALPLLSTRCSSSGASATGGACASPPTRAAAASRAPSRGWPRTRTSRLDPAQQAAARRLLLRLAGEDESGAIVRRRVALAELERRRTSPRSSPGSPTAACSRSPTARSRSRTRRCCASGRGCARWLEEDAQGRRCIASSPTPRAPGTRTRATPAGSTAARGSPSALDWARRPRARAQRDRARVPRRQPRARAGARSAACASCSPAWPRCWSSR